MRQGCVPIKVDFLGLAAIYMRKQFIILLILLVHSVSYADEACKTGPWWVQHACKRLVQTWNLGKNELYLPFYAWHNRYYYDPVRAKTYNENAWGGGLGKGFYDEDGDLHALFAFAFLDSHKNVEPALGYAFQKVWHINEDWRLGGGYTILVTARPDINDNIPFPGILPWASLSFKRASLMATYIPGHKNVGNVLFLVFKYTFN